MIHCDFDQEGSLKINIFKVLSGGGYENVYSRENSGNPGRPLI